MEENIKYYDAYEENLLKELIRTCASLGMMDNDLLASEDIDQKWKEYKKSNTFATRNANFLNIYAYETFLFPFDLRAH